MFQKEEEVEKFHQSLESVYYLAYWVKMKYDKNLNLLIKIQNSKYNMYLQHNTDIKYKKQLVK